VTVERSASAWWTSPGRACRPVRHGALLVLQRRSHSALLSLVRCLNIADGTVISQVHSRHRATEFRGFLTVIDKAAPAGLVVHLVCGSYVIHNTAEIKTWLARRPASTFSSRRPARRG